MVKTYNLGYAIVSVTEPDRTPEQQEAWEKRLHRATEDFFKAVITKEKKKCTTLSEL